MLNLAPGNYRFQGMPCGEQKNRSFCFFFFGEKEGILLCPRSGLLLYRTNRTKDYEKMSHCPFGIGFTNDGKATPLFCGKWSCENCRITNAKRWAYRASLHIAEQDVPAYFWTLTLRSGVHTAYQGYRVIPQSWDSLRKTMQRKTGQWSYLAFIEAHPKRSNIPHFHVLSLTAAPVVGTHKAMPIKDLAYQSGFGYMATEELVKSWKAAWYVAKYASKADPSIPPRFHRCRASRNWAKLPEQKLGAFMVKARSEDLKDFLLRVESVTDIGVDRLYERYRVAMNIWEITDYE